MGDNFSLLSFKTPPPLSSPAPPLPPLFLFLLLVLFLFFSSTPPLYLFFLVNVTVESQNLVMKDLLLCHNMLKMCRNLL